MRGPHGCPPQPWRGPQRAHCSPLQQPPALKPDISMGPSKCSLSDHHPVGTTDIPESASALIPTLISTHMFN